MTDISSLEKLLRQDLNLNRLQLDELEYDMPDFGQSARAIYITGYAEGLSDASNAFRTALNEFKKSNVMPAKDRDYLVKFLADFVLTVMKPVHKMTEA